MVLISIIYIKPRDLLRRLFLKHKWKEVFIDELFDPSQSNGRKSASVALGIFTAILPIWGFQLILAIFLAVVLRLNKGLVILFANLSIPPMVPLSFIAVIDSSVLMRDLHGWFRQNPRVYPRSVITSGTLREYQPGHLRRSCRGIVYILLVFSKNRAIA